MIVDDYVKLLNNKKEYLEKLKEYLEKLSEIEHQISLMIESKNREICTQVKKIFLEVFSPEELFWNEWMASPSARGKYKEDIKKILYQLDVTKYLIKRYADEFKGKGKIHRGARHHIYISVYYDIIKDNFELYLDHYGMYSIIRDEVLLNSTLIMFTEIDKIFEDKNLKIDDLKSKFISFKEIYSNSFGYYVTEELSVNGDKS